MHLDTYTLGDAAASSTYPLLQHTYYVHLYMLSSQYTHAANMMADAKYEHDGYHSHPPLQRFSTKAATALKTLY